MNKTKTLNHFLFFFVLYTLVGMTSGCKKEKITESVYSDFIGDWYSIEGTSGYMELYIEEGVGSWVSQEGIVNKTATGVPKILPNRDKLKLAFKKFDIDSYPALVDGDWLMTLDGVTYERY